MDTRGEVGVLNRNVKIVGAPTSKFPATDGPMRPLEDGEYFGATVVAQTLRVRRTQGVAADATYMPAVALAGVQFQHAGQRGWWSTARTGAAVSLRDVSGTGVLDSEQQATLNALQREGLVYRSRQLSRVVGCSFHTIYNGAVHVVGSSVSVPVERNVVYHSYGPAFKSVESSRRTKFVGNLAVLGLRKHLAWLDYEEELGATRPASSTRATAVGDGDDDQSVSTVDSSDPKWGPYVDKDMQEPLIDIESGERELDGQFEAEGPGVVLVGNAIAGSDSRGGFIVRYADPCEQERAQLLSGSAQIQDDETPPGLVHNRANTVHGAL